MISEICQSSVEHLLGPVQDRDIKTTVLEVFCILARTACDVQQRLASPCLTQARESRCDINHRLLSPDAYEFLNERILLVYRQSVIHKLLGTSVNPLGRELAFGITA